MLKTLTAALVAASVLIAPIAASAETAPATKPAAAAPAAKPAVTGKTAQTKGHKRHVARHHNQRKVMKHVRGHNKVATSKKAHKPKHVAAKVAKAPKVAN